MALLGKGRVLNLARSALNFFSSNSLCLNEDPVISRLFQYFYRKRPKRVKYFTFWPVKQLLTYLSKLHPPSSLSVKLLTLKTLALIALTSSDRGQTIHLMNINNVVHTENGLEFVIFQRLKTTRRVAKPHVISCINSDEDSLNVCAYTKSYMERTLPLRMESLNKGLEKPDDLFISWITKRPVTRQTIARWLRQCLDLAGIDSNIYGAHSFRGAGLSAAYRNGASIQDIVKHGSWSNTETFQRFYHAPERDSQVGQIILRQLENNHSEYNHQRFTL